MRRRLSGLVHVDRATARKILAGDERAFRQMFDSFFPRLYRFAVARLDGDREAARDVVQQTFCKGLEKLGSYRGEAALYTWFCQVCRNVLIDYCRANNRRQQRVVLFEDHAGIRAIVDAMAGPLIERPDTAAWQRDVQRMVQATVDALPGHYADVLEWKYVDGLTVREIATRLETTAKAAESLLTRAREAFKQAMVQIVDSDDALQPPANS